MLVAEVTGILEYKDPQSGSIRMTCDFCCFREKKVGGVKIEPCFSGLEKS